MDTPRNVPWYYIFVDGRQWLRAGGKDLLDSYGYKAPHGDYWLMPKKEFRDFEVAAEAVEGYDLDPYIADEMWEWNEVQHMLLRWGYR